MTKVGNAMLIRITYRWDGKGANPMDARTKDKYGVLVIPMDDEGGMTYRVTGAIHTVAQWLIEVTGDAPYAALWWLRNAEKV
jgi:hypothetical protein